MHGPIYTAPLLRHRKTAAVKAPETALRATNPPSAPAVGMFVKVPHVTAGTADRVAARGMAAINREWALPVGSKDISY